MVFYHLNENYVVKSKKIYTFGVRIDARYYIVKTVCLFLSCRFTILIQRHVYFSALTRSLHNLFKSNFEEGHRRDRSCPSDRVRWTLIYYLTFPTILPLTPHFKAATSKLLIGRFLVLGILVVVNKCLLFVICTLILLLLLDPLDKGGTTLIYWSFEARALPYVLNK